MLYDFRKPTNDNGNEYVVFRDNVEGQGALRCEQIFRTSDMNCFIIFIVE